MTYLGNGFNIYNLLVSFTYHQIIDVVLHFTLNNFEKPLSNMFA